MNKHIPPGHLYGKIQVPPSKSDAQRAILAAALSRSPSLIYNVGESDDTKAMILNVQNLGATVKKKNGAIEIIPGEFHGGPTNLNVGESGLGLRLITPVCSTFDGSFEIVGEGTLNKRPQGFFEDHLHQLGVRVSSKKGYLPLTVKGRLQGGELLVDGSISSQFLSGLLMALPRVEEDSHLRVQNLKSTPYVRMTMATLECFGIEIGHRNFEEFFIKGKQQYKGCSYAVESDWSAAGYWLVASALGNGLQCIGLSLDSVQADRAIIDALVAANCAVTADEEGIKVSGLNRRAFLFDATHCPDLFPSLVTLAALCPGESAISGVHRLKHKESDRAKALVEEFKKLGTSIVVKEDVMYITGSEELKSANLSSHDDHRITMCLAIAGLFTSNGVNIEGAECVSKSYPEFWEDLDSVLIP